MHINEDGDTYASGRPKPTIQLAIYGQQKGVTKLLAELKTQGWASPSELAWSLLSGWLADPVPPVDAGQAKVAKAPKAAREAKPPKAKAEKAAPKHKVKSKKAAKPKATPAAEPAPGVDTPLPPPETQQAMQEARRAKSRAKL